MYASNGVFAADAPLPEDYAIEYVTTEESDSEIQLASNNFISADLASVNNTAVAQKHLLTSTILKKAFAIHFGLPM